jgi:trans-aconitate 2-methyltransferase
MKVVDLGCGTGELTRRLADRLPDSDVVGIDTSEEMLAEARTFERPGLRFERRDLRDLEGEWDLIFSHATIHWVEDHHTLIRELFSRTAPEGQLALQFPSNHHHAAHKLVLETASEEPFKTALGGWKWVYPLLPVAAYAEILYEAGAEDLRVFEKVYPHVMDNADALAAWLAGTTLVPYLERMDDVTKEYFMQVFRSKLRRLWPSGPLFYPFRRIFVSAVKPEVIS